jgi:rare lipoprotein A (peptidoglycan hydrolase)
MAHLSAKGADELSAGHSGAIEQQRLFTEKGLASWYGGRHGKIKDNFGYKRTASGRIMNPEEFICAHRTLPFGTIVSVENLSNGRSVLLRVVDRGPFVDGRIIDVSLRAAREIGLLSTGVAKVRVQIAKNMLRTNYPMASAAAGTQPERPLSAWAASTIGVVASSLFVSPLSPFIPSAHSVSETFSSCLGAFFQTIQELMARFKKLRLDPFINRKP